MITRTLTAEQNLVGVALLTIRPASAACFLQHGSAIPTALPGGAR
jgi:hypothetical protein